MTVRFILSKSEKSAINVSSVATLFIRWVEDKQRFIIYATLKNSDEWFNCSEYLTEEGAKQDLKLLVDVINKP